MAYNIHLADRVREHLSEIPSLKVEEKAMFGGLAFLINGKMCVNVSGENLMCRFDPRRLEELAEKTGFLPMFMRGRQLNGYCYVEPIGLEKDADLKLWLDACLEFNERARRSRKG